MDNGTPISRLSVRGHLRSHLLNIKRKRSRSTSSYPVQTTMNVPKSLGHPLGIPHPRPTTPSTSLTPILSGLNLASSAPTIVKTEWGATQSDAREPPLVQSLKTEPMDHTISAAEGSTSPWDNSSPDSDMHFAPKIIKTCYGAEAEALMYTGGCHKRPLEEEITLEHIEETAEDEEAFHRLKKVKFELLNEIDPIQPRKLAFSPDRRAQTRCIPRKRAFLALWACARCQDYFTKQKDYNTHKCKPGPVSTNSEECC